MSFQATSCSMSIYTCPSTHTHTRTHTHTHTHTHRCELSVAEWLCTCCQKRSYTQLIVCATRLGSRILQSVSVTAQTVWAIWPGGKILCPRRKPAMDYDCDLVLCKRKKGKKNDWPLTAELLQSTSAALILFSTAALLAAEVTSNMSCNIDVNRC